MLSDRDRTKSDKKFAADAKWVERDLASLKKLLEKGADNRLGIGSAAPKRLAVAFKGGVVDSPTLDTRNGRCIRKHSA